MPTFSVRHLTCTPFVELQYHHFLDRNVEGGCNPHSVTVIAALPRKGLVRSKLICHCSEALTVAVFRVMSENFVNRGSPALFFSDTIITSSWNASYKTIVLWLQSCRSYDFSRHQCLHPERREGESPILRFSAACCEYSLLMIGKFITPSFCTAIEEAMVSSMIGCHIPPTTDSDILNSVNRLDFCDCKKRHSLWFSSQQNSDLLIFWWLNRLPIKMSYIQTINLRPVKEYYFWNFSPSLSMHIYILEHSSLWPFFVRFVPSGTKWPPLLANAHWSSVF
jgi:hypothetical protein